MDAYLKTRDSLLNAPDYADRVNLIKKIKVNNTWRFASVVPEPNGRLKDRVRVNDTIETHLEGAYYIEWRERGKRCRVSVRVKMRSRRRGAKRSNFAPYGMV